MSEEKKQTSSNKCKSKKSMLVFGIIQLGSTVVSAVSLALIAFSLCTLKKDANFSNNCVNELIKSGEKVSIAVRYCNGGN